MPDLNIPITTSSLSASSPSELLLHMPNSSLLLLSRPLLPLLLRPLTSHFFFFGCSVLPNFVAHSIANKDRQGKINGLILGVLALMVSKTASTTFCRSVVSKKTLVAWFHRRRFLKGKDINKKQ